MTPSVRVRLKRLPHGEGLDVPGLRQLRRARGMDLRAAVAEGDAGGAGARRAAR